MSSFLIGVTFLFDWVLWLIFIHAQNATFLKPY